MRIALIHATPLAIDPVAEAFARHWSDASVMNLLDDHLSVDRAAHGLTDGIAKRIHDLADYAAASGAAGILYTCSAFGPAIEAVAKETEIPVLKPNEAMFSDALKAGGATGLLASFAPSLAPMADEFTGLAESVPGTAALETACAPDALEALSRGDGAAHDRSLATAASALQGVETIMLAQFSTARAKDAVAQATGKHVLTSPDSAVRALRHRLVGE